MTLLTVARLSGFVTPFPSSHLVTLTFRELAQKVKDGVWQAGGVPFEFPVMSLGETNLRPTAMLFRNLASMDVEESIRGNPIDGVVLMTGCDKTTPSLLMGAASLRRTGNCAPRAVPC